MKVIEFGEFYPDVVGSLDEPSIKYFLVEIGSLGEVLRLLGGMSRHCSGDWNRIKTNHHFEIFTVNQNGETVCKVLMHDDENLFQFAQLLKKEGFLIKGDFLFVTLVQSKPSA